MLYYISEQTLDDAIEAYNNRPGNKQFENITFLPVQENGTVSLAVVIIYSIKPDTAAMTNDTPSKKMPTRFIGQTPPSE